MKIVHFDKLLVTSERQGFAEGGLIFKGEIYNSNLSVLSPWLFSSYDTQSSFV